MNYDLRYDGPDLESDLNNRGQSLLTVAMMAHQGLGTGLGERGQKASKRDEAALAADQMVWRDTPAGAELSGMVDEALAHRWTAAAAHPDHADANEARTRIEAELDRRDPETMRDYRSWRNALGLPPGQAMQQALAERNARLEQVWKPLTEPGVTTMGTDEVLDRWAAAHAAHDTPENADALETARKVGEDRLRELDPVRADAWKAMQAEQPSPVKGLGSRPGLSQADAAARTAGRATAFLPGPGGATAGWGAVATKGVKVATTVARATPAAPVAVTVDTGMAAARVAHHAMSRVNRP